MSSTTFTQLSLVVALLLVSPIVAVAEMSVDGFFPADYARSDIFSSAGKEADAEPVAVRENGNNQNAEQIEQSATANALMGAAGMRVVPPIARTAHSLGTQVRPRSGRFVKTTQGTIRSSVQQSEWDVGPLLPPK